MRRALASLLLLLPFTAHSAELVKRSKTKAVLNMKKSELAELEVGEEVYLVDAADEVVELLVEKINGQLVTVSGEIAELESGIAYQVRMDKPRPAPKVAIAQKPTSSHHEEDDGEDDISTPFHVELGYGKRWYKDDEDYTREESAIEARFAYQPESMPLSFGLFYNRFSPKLENEDGVRVIQDNLHGDELGLRVEFNTLIDRFMPFLGIRYSIFKTLEGSYQVQFSEPDYFGSQTFQVDYDLKTNPWFDLGFRLVTDNYGFFILGKKAVPEQGKGKLHIKSDIYDFGNREIEDVRVSGQYKNKFDEMSLGIWISF